MLAAPLVIGSVHVESQLVLGGGISLLFAMSWLYPKQRFPRFGVSAWAGLVWLAWSLILLTPWPSGVVALVSGEASAVYTGMGELLGRELAPSLALDRPRGASTTALLLIYALTALTVWSRTLQSTRSARSPIPYYAVFAGVLVATVALVHTTLGATLIYGVYAPSVPLAHEPIRGPMVNPNHTAAFLLLTSLVTFGAWLQAAERIKALLLASSWALMVVLIVMSGSRANITLLVVTHLYLLWFVRGGASPFRTMKGFWLCVGVGAIGALGLVIGVKTLTPAFSGESATFLSELVMRWSTGLQVLVDRPFGGHGPGNFGIAASLHTSDWYTGYLSRAHNLPLQLMSEWGAPLGLGLFGLLLWWLGRLLVGTIDTPSRHAAALGVAALVVQNMVDFSLLIPGVGLVWVATAAWLGARTQPEGADASPWTWRHAVLGVACITTLALLLMVAYQGDARRADLAIRSAEGPEEAAQLTRQALSIHPADFHLHVLGGARALQGGDPVFAHQLAQRAQALAPGAPSALALGVDAAFQNDAPELAQESLRRLCHDVVYWREQCLNLLLKHRERREILSEILGQDVALTLALVNRLRQRGHRDATTTVLSWARGRFPEDLNVHEELVESWLRIPEAADALDALSVDLLAQSADEEDPKRKKRLQRLGYLVQARLVERESRYLEARHLYQEAAALDPERSVEPLLHAARVLLKLNDYKRLEGVLKALRVAMGPHDVVARVSYHRLQSTLLVKTGRLQASLRSLHAAIRLSPRDPTLYDALAAVLDLTGDKRGVERARQKAADLR